MPAFVSHGKTSSSYKCLHCAWRVPSASTCVLLYAGSGEDTSCLDLQQAVKSLRIVPKITRTISSACMKFTCRIDATIAHRHPSILVQCNPPVRQQRWRRTEHGRTRCLGADQEMLLMDTGPCLRASSGPCALSHTRHRFPATRKTLRDVCVEVDRRQRGRPLTRGS